MATETWTYDGFNLSNYVSGAKIYDLRTWNGLDNIPGVNVSGNSTGTSSGTNGMFQLAQTHGEYWYPQYYTAATRKLTMHVSSNNGSTGASPTSVDQARQNFDTNLDFLSKLFARRRNLASLVRTLSSGQQRLGLVTVDSPIEPALVPVTDAMITVELTFPDPFWRDTTDTALASGIAPGFSGTVSSMAAATAPMQDLQFIVTGPVTNPRITDNESGHWVQYTGTVPAGDTLTIVNTTMNISGTGFTPALTNMTHSGDTNWLTLYPTASNGVSVAFSGSSTTGATALEIYGHLKYMR